nr:sodium/glucose cotransporter 2-like [Anser cygnoides]
MVPEFVLGTGTCEAPGRCPAFICGLHYLHFAIVLFLATCAIVIVVSLCYPPIPQRHLHRLVFSLRHSQEPRDDLDKEPPLDGDVQLQNVEVEPSGQGAEPSGQGAEPSGQGAEPSGQGAEPGGQGAEPGGAGGVAKYVAPPPEDPVWGRVVNVNALIMTAVAVFLWGYFA